MKDGDTDALPLTPELVLRAYGVGVCPMADHADSSDLYWVDPRRRGVLPLDGFRLSRSLRRRLLRDDYIVRVNTAFDAVLDACADRPETWINDAIRRVFIQLHQMGHAHSVEIWQKDELAGGLYGLQLGAAFFGESMFRRISDGSKIALAHLVARLRAGGFVLLDTQFTTPHLESLGAVSVTRLQYHEKLSRALIRRGDFYSLPEDCAVSEVVQLITQRS